MNDGNKLKDEIQEVAFIIEYAAESGQDTHTM